MRFDDRIKTVLDHPVADDRDRAVRWRQLIDLLSRIGGDSDPNLVQLALDTARSDRDTVPDTVRAATARSIAGRPVDPRLVALFAGDRLDVAAPLLAAANLDERGKAEVAAAASEEVRRLFLALGNGPASAPSEPLTLTERAPAQAVEEKERPPTIGEMVARIERRRQSRSAAKPAPVADAPRLFRWESDASGAIAWVDGAPRAALIGRLLAGHPREALVGEENRPVLGRRAPFVDLPMSVSEPFEGEWRVSGAPAFSPGEGRFVGYRGIARRIDAAPNAPTSRRSGQRHDDADALRELIHEIKTPLNAIIGFAEIIDGQFLGPAHRNYRQRASNIVAQARSLLAAVEDLDLAAKLQAGRQGRGPGTQFSDLFPRLAEELQAHAAGRNVAMSFEPPARSARCALEPELAERMVRRFLAAVIDAASDGESLRTAFSSDGERCAIRVQLPEAISGHSAEQLFDASFGSGEQGPIGIGLTLRLIRGLAQSVGGDLSVEHDQIGLLLPARS